MTATPPEYRIIARPAPGVALIATSLGGVERWELQDLVIGHRRCTRCARPAWRYYRPALAGVAVVGCFCRPCLDQVAGPAENHAVADDMLDSMFHVALPHPPPGSAQS